MHGKLLKIEQASEKPSCKSGIFLYHIVRPLTQPNCLEIEHGLFSQASGTLQGHLSGMLMAFAYIFVDLLEGKGESPCVFWLSKKVIHQIFIEQAIHMSPCKTGLTVLWVGVVCGGAK